MIAKFRSVVRRLQTGPVNIIKSGKTVVSAITRYTVSLKNEARRTPPVPDAQLLHHQQDTYEADIVKSRAQVSKRSYL